MRFQRITLLLSSAVFGAFGALFLARPAEMASTVEVRADSPTARTEIRAMYGGLELGMAAFLAVCARKDAWVRPGLVASAAALAGLATGRAAGMIVEAQATPLLTKVLAAEVVAAGVSWAALVTAPTRPAPLARRDTR